MSAEPLKKQRLPQPSVATIQDFACFGRSSLSVALPVVSAAGVRVSAIPAEVLSSHTGGLGAPVVCRLDDALPGIIDHWVSLGLRFDIVYTGYLANERQLEQAERLAEAFCKRGALFVVDPAMADGGRLYSGLDDSVVIGMKRLCARADVILPNATEAALLTGLPYNPSPSGEALEKLMSALLALGAKSALLTGAQRREGYIGAALSQNGGRSEIIETRRIDGDYHGGGDLFASAVVACLARGLSLESAARCAVRFTAESLKLTLEAGGDEREGIRFEPLLRELPRIIEEEKSPQR